MAHHLKVKIITIWLKKEDLQQNIQSCNSDIDSLKIRSTS